MTDALEIRGLSKWYGKRQAIDSISFAARKGKVVGLLGPNGAGKSTTLLCLSGLLRPDEGEIRLGDEILGNDRGRTISLIPETPDVYPMLTVWEHLVFVAKLLDLDSSWIARGDELIHRLGLGLDRDTLGHALSKGLRQKTLIASTILAQTPVLLLDEPMIGLDPHGQRELREIVHELRDEGRIVILSTHMLSLAELVCDDVVILRRGQGIMTGNIAELVSGRKGSFEDLFMEVIETDGSL